MPIDIYVLEGDNDTGRHMCAIDEEIHDELFISLGLDLTNCPNICKMIDPYDRVLYEANDLRDLYNELGDILQRCSSDADTKYQYSCLRSACLAAIELQNRLLVLGD